MTLHEIVKRASASYSGDLKPHFRNGHPEFARDAGDTLAYFIVSELHSVHIKGKNDKGVFQKS